MKDANHIFTKMRLGLDLRVWFFMLFVLLISIMVLGFKMVTHVTCADYEIATLGVSTGKKNNFYTGETVTFIAAVPAGKEVVWDFGDGTPLVHGTKRKHTFLQEGNYTVTSTVNERCIETITVNIRTFVSKALVLPSPGERQDVISGIDTPHVGESAEYFSAIAANSYEWSVLNAPEFPTLTNNKASYKFVLPGNQIIMLKIDGDENKVYRKNIYVLPSVKSKVQSKAPLPPLPLPKALPPKISAFSPPSGSTGTLVTISGTGLNDVVGINFGGTPATSFNVLSSTTITAVVGTGTTGDISIITKNGSATLPAFTFIPPAPAVIAPVKPKFPIIPPEEFKRMFDQVCAGKMDASDFNPYLCSGDQTKVQSNSKWTNVKDFCELLKDRKKKFLGHKDFSVKSVKVTRDGNSQNCVILINVEYK